MNVEILLWMEGTEEGMNGQMKWWMGGMMYRQMDEMNDGLCGG